MSERYTRLFSLSENLYALGSPVLIAAGALLKDNQTGKVLAQLKMRSITGKNIKAATVRFSPFDTVGQPIGDAVEHQYLDLAVVRDADFGQKEPVRFPDVTARSFGVTVTEVVFSDNSIWKATDEPWEPLQKPTDLMLAIGESELLKQYRLTYGEDCNYSFTEEKDLWYCACGALNRDVEDNCHRCRKSHSVLRDIDMKELSAARDARLLQEQQEREEAERIAAEKKALVKEKAVEAGKKTAKVAKIVIPIIAACVVIAIVVTQVVIPNGKYNSAMRLLESGQYEEAIEAFTALEGYKDSEDQVKAAKYGIGERHLAEGNYDSAISAFRELGDYQDSETRISDIKYTQAMEAFNAKKFEQAKNLFLSIKDYRDSEDKIADCNNEIANEKEKKNAAIYTQAVEAFNAKNYDEALQLFRSIKGYRDSDDIVDGYISELLASFKKYEGEYGMVTKEGNILTSSKRVIGDFSYDWDTKQVVVSYTAAGKTYVRKVKESDLPSWDYYIEWGNVEGSTDSKETGMRFYFKVGEIMEYEYDRNVDWRYRLIQ